MILQFRNLALLSIFMIVVSFSAIAQPIAITAPLGGESWLGGTDQNISWTTVKTQPVLIELWNGAIYSTITTTLDGTSPYLWSISNSLITGSDYKIRLTQDGDVSESGTFTITPQVINVTTPNASGIIWARGTSQTIDWTDNVPGNVNISLWDGASYTSIASGIAGNSYLWAIGVGQSLGSTYKIKVSSSANASIFDESDNNFRITAPVVLSSPNGGEIWATGSTHNITWTEGSGTNTKIELWDSNTALKVYDITTGVVGYSYSWTIGATANGSDYIVKIIDLGDASTDVSDADFRITQPVVVGYPNLAGLIWPVGSTHNITWTEGSGTNTKIELWDSNTSLKVYDITTGVVGYSYSWTIGATANGSDYIIKIIDLGDASTDVSNNDFRITQPVVVTSPNGGESWANESSHNITWTGGTGNVTIELFKGGVLYSTLISGQATPYGWLINVPDAANDYKIKVTDAGDLTTDMSNSNFTITQSVHVTYPTVPGISWNLGSTNVITWTDNVPGPVIVELYYNGVFHSVLAPSVPDGTTSFSWTIPTNHLMGNYFKVRVSSIADPTIVDMSDHLFRIDAATNTYDITVIQPSLPAIRWVKGESYLVSWTDNLASPVKVELVNFGVTPATIATISASVVGSTVAWTIPGGTASGSQYKIMVTSTTENGVIDLSDNYFEIASTSAEANIVVEQPTIGGLTWLRGSTYLISWTDNIQNNDVTLQLLNSSDVFVRTIATGVPGSTYLWYIDPALYSNGNYKVNVVYADASGKSAVPFAIADSPAGAYIDILQPDVSGITWLRGQSYLISWEDNIPGPVDIYYERTSVPAEISIASNVVGSTYVWNVPAIVEDDDYFITIRSHADPTKFGISANPFAILDYMPGSFIFVLQPNGGETWTKGNSYYISWDNDFDENVKIELVNYATATTTVIDPSVPGSTTVWTIPNTGVYPAGILYKMKISSTENPALFDESDAYFTIVDPAFAPVVYPNPADMFFTIQLNEELSDNYVVALTDRFNMQVMKRTYNSSDLKDLRISTGEFSNGVYFLTITSENSVITKKIIIQH